MRAGPRVSLNVNSSSTVSSAVINSGLVDQWRLTSRPFCRYYSYYLDGDRISIIAKRESTCQPKVRLREYWRIFKSPSRSFTFYNIGVLRVATCKNYAQQWWIGIRVKAIRAYGAWIAMVDCQTRRCDKHLQLVSSLIWLGRSRNLARKRTCLNTSGIEMDRSFKNNADFKMNQQNFKLTDFGIDVKSSHESKNAAQSNQCKVRRNAQVNHRYVHAENARVQQISMNPGRVVASGTSLLQVACNHSHSSPCNSLMTSNHHRNSPNQLGQIQNTPVADRFQASSPNNLSGTGSIVQLGSSPSYWKQYGGQESGVNIQNESQLFVSWSDTDTGTVSWGYDLSLELQFQKEHDMNQEMQFAYDDCCRLLKRADSWEGGGERM